MSSAVNTMEYRILGRSGVSVSRFCLGAMMFGGPTDAQDRGRDRVRRSGGRD